PQLEQWLLQQEIARHGLLPLTIQPYLQLTQMVAVVGGGAAGLAAAAFLYQKGFRVTIYEQSSVLGGSLKKNPGISAPLLRAELAFFTENCNIKLNCRVGWDISLATLCALYPGIVLAVPTGEDVGLGAGQLAYDPLTLQLQTDPRLFWAGLPPQGDVSLAGRFACAKQGAISVDRYAKQVSLTASRWRGGSYRSDLPVNLPGQSRPTVIAGGGGYTETEAVAEAGRCLDCHCRECLRQCRMLEKFGKTPRQYIREIANNLIITMGIRKANMMINSCSQCGLCRDVCPNGLDMGGVFLAARENMVKKGNMPERVYDFPLRDMLFSVSGEFDLWREDPAGGADYLFFPGCQLAAGAPQYIAPLYQHLRQILPGGVGLGLSCCGAPAHWAGQQELKQQTREKLMAEWRRLGQPILITGCTTCYQEFLPVIGAEKLTTVWDVLAQYGLPPQETALPGHVFAIHDPCTSRQMGETQANLRKIAVQLGCRIREMPHSGADTRCCGYGG
ncbi:MAG: (Fe-S)-binding protein, partial [Clostridiales bacterium]